MRIFDNSSEVKLPRASMDAIPRRLNVIDQAVDVALQSAYRELVSRRTINTEAVGGLIRSSIEQPAVLSDLTLINNNQPEIESSDQSDIDRVRRLVEQSFEYPNEDKRAV
jgi:hypothetical protein